MPDHYLATIRQLKHNLKRADEWRPHEFTDCMNALIAYLMEVEEFLQVAAVPSPMTAVLSHTLKCETAEMLQGSCLQLFRNGLLEKFYQRIPDPTYLSSTIQRLINQNDDPENLAMARETLRLGAIFIPENTKSCSELLEDDQRLPVDVCKGLLKNYLDYAWAYDQSRLSNSGARDFTIALLTVCADAGEEDFVIEFLEQAHDSLLPDRSLNNDGRETPIHAYYQLILQHCRHEQLLARLAEFRPVLYQSLIRDHHYQEGLLTKITDPKPGEVFDVSRLPPSSAMDEEFLSHALCKLSKNGKLNAARYQVIARAWVNAGFPGSVEIYAKGFKPMREQLAELKEYRNTIFNELSITDLWSLKKKQASFHQSLLILDFIYTAPAKQILNNAVALDRHHAMHVLKHDEIPETLKVGGTVMVTPLLLAACLKRVKVMSDYDGKNSEIEAVITDAFSNPFLHGTIKKLSEKQLFQVRRYAPCITDEVIRTIQWDDLKILADMFSEDLGL
ncbi:hypothetical protein V0M98_34930 (plasmid) [Pseudomonas silesiensis]|uniref:hypothetical protein n=1 Tax=Pseudomonas silesiensis TaxID=1853130 RepID=UPI0030CD7532